MPILMDVAFLELNGCRLGIGHVVTHRVAHVDIIRMGDGAKVGANEVVRCASEHPAQARIDAQKATIQSNQRLSSRRIVKRTTEAFLALPKCSISRETVGHV